MGYLDRLLQRESDTLLCHILGFGRAHCLVQFHNRSAPDILATLNIATCTLFYQIYDNIKQIGNQKLIIINYKNHSILLNRHE